MNKKIFLLIFCVFFTTISFSQNNKYQKETVKVSGNCGMCKSIIEKTAESIDGVKYARWDSGTSLMKVKFLTKKTDLNKIQKAIANIGYDTELYRANDESYNNLHYCCKYDRK